MVKIRTGEANPDVDNLFIASRLASTDSVVSASWAYITAWNPASQLLDDSENAARQDELRREVAARVVSDEVAAYYEGEGVPDVGDWTPEASLLIIGIDRGAASALGARFGQNAILVGDWGGRADLLLCEQPSSAAERELAGLGPAATAGLAVDAAPTAAATVSAGSVEHAGAALEAA